MEKIVKSGLRDCTVNLDGTECAVRFDGCSRVFAVRNDSAGDVYISKTAGIVPDADGVMSVKAGASTVYAHMDMYADTVYLLGKGKVQLHAQNDVINPFNYAPAMDGGEERGGSSYTIENAVDYPLLGLTVYGKSLQDGVPTPENPVEIVSVGDNEAVAVRSCGKNFYEGSQDWSGTWVYGDIYETADETYHGLPVKKKTAPWAGISKYIYVQKGQTVTFSCYVKSDVDVSAQMFITSSNDPQATALPKNANKIVNVSTKWARYEMSYTCIQSGFIRPRIEKSEYIDGAFYVCGFQIEIGGTATDYEPYEGNTANITTAMPLCGIPVESGGNYTDSNGQQWVCDELIYNADGSGKIVKRILKFVFDDNTNWNISEQTSTELAFTKDNNDVYETVKNNDLVGVVKSDLAQLASRNFLRNNPYYVGLQMEGYAVIGFSLPKGQYTKTEWKEIAKGHYVLLKYKNPKEIELTAAEMTALRELQTYNGVTNIFDDGGADMDVKFCTNKMLSEYVLPITTGLQKQIDELKSAVLSLGGNV